MRIAVNAWFYDQPKTGSGQYVRNLLTALRGLAPTVQFELVKPHSQSDIAKVAFEQIQFPGIAQRMGADAAFVPYWAPPLSCSVPVIVTIHDVIPIAIREYRGGVLQRLYAALVRAATASATQVITDSEYSRHDIVRLLPVDTQRVQAVPLAADASMSSRPPEDDVDRVRERYQLPDTYVVYLGGFDRRKNIETLLQVYSWCGETIGSEFPLVVTGDVETIVVANNGRQMTLGQMMQELELDGNVVKLIGRIAEEDKPALFAGARCFLYPSTYEGFGLPALEAMACGTPVVGSNASSIPEVVGNAGMLVDAMDSRRMAGALIAVCTDDQLHARLRQLSLLRAAQFSWQRTAMETLSVINQVLHRQRAFQASGDSTSRPK